MFKRIKFQEVLESILAARGLLEEFYSDKYKEVVIKLSMKDYDDLTIIRTGYLVLVGHYYVTLWQNPGTHKLEELNQPNPIFRFVLQEDNLWYPYKTELLLSTFECACYEETTQYPLITKVFPPVQKRFIFYSKMFAKIIERQGWLKAELKQVTKIEKQDIPQKEQTCENALLKESVKNEIIEALEKETLPPSAMCISNCVSPYERLWLYEYKDFYFLLGDPLTGFYAFVDMLEDFLQKVALPVNELINNFSTKNMASNY